MRCSHAATRGFDSAFFYGGRYRLRLVSDHLSLVTYHSNVGEIAGEPQWLRVQYRSEECAGDPLNLMRVMPPKGGPEPDWQLSHAILPRTAFLFNHKWTRIDT